MQRKSIVLAGISIATILSVGAIAYFQAPKQSNRELAPDRPGEEEDLNRELWEFAKKNPIQILIIKG